MAALGLVLLLIPAILAYLDGVGIARLFDDYRAQFIYPLLIAYLLVACHLVGEDTRERSAGFAPSRTIGREDVHAAGEPRLPG